MLAEISIKTLIKMLYKEFYSELGKLLYAVSDIDGEISKTEKQKLHDIVKEELVPKESHVDVYGTNSAFYSEIEFDFLDEEISDARAAFESFISFVEDHHSAFDQNMKKTSLRIMKELADVYYGTNKKEKELIQKATGMLNKIEVKKSKDK
jgi:uncharacterized tellurite resistance protein B-like protein